MHRLLNSFLILIFGLWIIPLGAFYTRAQASRFCGGHRAICLCPQEDKDKNSAREKTANITPRTASSNGHENGGGANENMLLPDLLVLISDPAQKYTNFVLLIPIQAISKSPEPIPKA